MERLLHTLYGPNAAADPYFQFFADAQALIPWWYPTLIIGITACILGYKLAVRMQYQRQAAAAAQRVQRRTRRRSYVVSR